MWLPIWYLDWGSWTRASSHGSGVIMDSKWLTMVCSYFTNLLSFSGFSLSKKIVACPWIFKISKKLSPLWLTDALELIPLQMKVYTSERTVCQITIDWALNSPLVIPLFLLVFNLSYKSVISGGVFSALFKYFLVDISYSAFFVDSCRCQAHWLFLHTIQRKFIFQ